MSPQETNVLFELVSALHDFERRSHRRTKTLEAVCEHPEIGELVAVLGYDFLLETLELEESIFAAEYPQMKFIGADARRSMGATVREHFEECRRCRSEARKDRNWRTNFARFLRTEKKVVRKILMEKRKKPRNKARVAASSS